MMFVLGEGLRSAFAAIRAHGFRSFLTALGIIIGVAAVIAVVSIVQGLSHTVNAQFQGLGSNAITVRSYTPLQQQLRGRMAQLTESDLRAIRHRVDGISHVTPILFDPAGQRGQVSYGAKTHFTQVFGVGPSYMEVTQAFPQQGRFFARSDEERRRMVCLIGPEAAKNLELPNDGMGEFIKIGSDWCRIVGVMEERGEIFGFSQDDYVLLPYSTMQRLIGNTRPYDLQVQLKVDDLERMEEVESRIRRTLRHTNQINGSFYRRVRTLGAGPRALRERRLGPQAEEPEQLAAEVGLDDGLADERVLVDREDVVGHAVPFLAAVGDGHSAAASRPMARVRRGRPVGRAPP